MDFNKYTVVTSDDFGKFEDRVNQLIGDGWKLQGGVSSATLPDVLDGLVHVQWSQALVLPVRAATASAVEEDEEPIPAELESDADIAIFPEKERPGSGSGTAIPY